MEQFTPNNKEEIKNLTLGLMNTEIKNLNRNIKDFTEVSKESISSTDKGSQAMRKLTRALVFVGAAQVVATIVSIFVK